jgi:hypothetical protein
MPLPRVVKLAETHVHLRLQASSEFLTPDFSKTVPSGERTIIWDPEVAGLLGGGRTEIRVRPGSRPG